MDTSKFKNDKEFGKFDFLGKATVFAGVSALLVIASLGVIFAKGFNYGIDFSGGTEIQVQFEETVGTAKIRQVTGDLGFGSATVQSIGEDNEFLVRLGVIKGKDDAETNQRINEAIQTVTKGYQDQFQAAGVVIRRVDSVGPAIGDELKKNGLLAVFYSLLMILIYVGFRFDFQYAPGAVICLFHDAVITLGIFSLLQREVNVQTLAAVLTIIGYSLNDTIVTFDRIRENVKLFRDHAFAFVVNRSLNDVLSRTLLTSITTMLAVAAMLVFASGVIKDFAFTLAIGVIVGTYSSMYVASPLVIAVNNFTSKK
ncbi:MAG: protein translocase subunit SecF [Bdellovibrionaceae bacterium]|nr:protein translocase subunit SecF [Pseudobdellovibrionaceae bacterium]|tara:strand:+ start:14958 stop:15893 length:936 start_codon:yes stop_codon:yes gene_type:complete